MKAAKQEVESLGGTVEIFRVDGVDAGRVDVYKRQCLDCVRQ